MKKIFTIVALSLLVWGCAKKMAPAKTTVPASNNGSVISTPSTNAEKPTTVINTPAPVNNPTLFTTNPNEVGGTKTVVKSGTQSPELLSQIAGQNTFTAKCGRCHQYKVTTDYTADRWASIMAVMANATHANLTETEKENVLAYVRANSKK